MTEVLVDYTQFEVTDLATQLHEAVVANEPLLHSRNLLGVIARYGASQELAEQNVRRGQTNIETGVTQHYAVVNEAGNVVGSASSFPDLPLRKLHLPIPPALAVPPLAVTFKYANPNIHAWTDVKEEEVLVGAYRQLAAMNMSGTPYGKPTESPWTIEPIRSPRHIHTALKMADLTRVATRFFDDGESRKRIPPISSLYIKSNTEWLTAHGRQKEVKKGQWKSGWQEIWDDADEYIARHGFEK
jgi:hypothetical protein